MTDQPFAESVMGDSMDADLLPELSCETWVTAVHLDEATGDLTPPNFFPDLIASSFADKTLTVVRNWLRSGTPRPGQNVPVCPRSSAHGDSSLVIHPWTLPVDFGIATHPRRLHFNSWCRRALCFCDRCLFLSMDRSMSFA